MKFEETSAPTSARTKSTGLAYMKDAVPHDHSYCRPPPLALPIESPDPAAAVKTKGHSKELKRLLLLAPAPSFKISDFPTTLPGVDDDLKSLKDFVGMSFDHLFPPGSPSAVHCNDNSLNAAQVPTVKKPPYSYRELAEFALLYNSAMTVGEICSWIIRRFDYYRLSPDAEFWKLGIRRALSKYSKFQKSSKVPGMGHLWCLQSPQKKANNSIKANSDKHWKRQKMSQYKKAPTKAVKRQPAKARARPKPPLPKYTPPQWPTPRDTPEEQFTWDDLSFSSFTSSDFGSSTTASPASPEKPDYEEASLSKTSTSTTTCRPSLLNPGALLSNPACCSFPTGCSNTHDIPSLYRDELSIGFETDFESAGTSSEEGYNSEMKGKDNDGSLAGGGGGTWATVSISTISLEDLPALGFEDISVFRTNACLELSMNQ